MVIPFFKTCPFKYRNLFKYYFRRNHTLYLLHSISQNHLMIHHNISWTDEFSVLCFIVKNVCKFCVCWFVVKVFVWSSFKLINDYKLFCSAMTTSFSTMLFRSAYSPLFSQFRHYLFLDWSIDCYFVPLTQQPFHNPVNPYFFDYKYIAI